MKILKQLERFEEDSDVRAVVLRLNSPGGAVAPSQEIYEAVKQFPKPVVASMASVAASGAYYIACGAEKVFANPGTITGSIGVIMEFANLEKLYEWAKVKRFAIKTGRFKDSGADYKSMAPEDRALLQGMVDDVLIQFKKAVAEGREMTMEQVTAVADGRIFSGAQAKRAKLVDELGTLQDAVMEAGKLAKIKGKPNVVYPSKPRRSGLLDLMLDDRASSEDAQSVFDLVSKFLGAGASAEAPVSARGLVREALTGLSPGVYWLWTGE